MARFVMFHSTKTTDETRLSESGKRGTNEFLACETSIEKYNKCIQSKTNISSCSKIIFDEDYVASTYVKDSKWWGDSWSFTLPGPLIKNQLKVHIPC